MTVDQILKYVNYICVKENSGSTLNPDQFNIILNACNISMFNRKIQEAQVLSIQSKMPFNEAIFEHAALKEFRTIASITFAGGSYALSGLSPNVYAYWGSLITLHGGYYRKIEILPDDDLTIRRTNMLAPQLDENPACMFIGNTIKVYPTDITTSEFVYMKMPATPVWDYYIDANANKVYLPPTPTSYVLTAGQTASDGTAYPYTYTPVKTVELEWNSLWHVEFCNEVLQKVGINLKDEQIRQYVREVEGKQV